MPAHLQPRRAVTPAATRRMDELVATPARIVVSLAALLVVALVAAALSLPSVRAGIAASWRTVDTVTGVGALEGRDGAGSAAPGAVGPAGTAVLDYTRMTGLPDGVVIREPGDVDALSGAPQDFRDYVANRISGVSATSECPSLIGVQQMTADGYAVGVLRGCGDVQVAWVKVNGVWKTVANGAQALDCSVLTSQKVPPAMADLDCPQPRSALVTFRQTPTGSTVRAGTSPQSDTARQGTSKPARGPDTNVAIVTPPQASSPPPSPAPTAVAPTDVSTALPDPEGERGKAHKGNGKSAAVCPSSKGQNGSRGEAPTPGGQPGDAGGACPTRPGGEGQQKNR